MSPPLLVNRGAAERRLPAPATRHPPGTRRASAARSPPHAGRRPVAHSPAPGERSHRRLLPSLPPSCQVEPGLPPPDPSFAIGSRRRRNRPGPPSAAPGTAPLSPGSCRCRRRRRGGSSGGGWRRRLLALPVSGEVAAPRLEVPAWGGADGSSPPGEAGPAVPGVRRARRAQLLFVGTRRRGRKPGQPQESPPRSRCPVGRGRGWRGGPRQWSCGARLLLAVAAAGRASRAEGLPVGSDERLERVWVPRCTVPVQRFGRTGRKCPASDNPAREGRCSVCETETRRVSKGIFREPCSAGGC